MYKWKQRGLETLAHILWEAGFSESPCLNWRMAELLMADEEFHAMVDAGLPQGYVSDGEPFESLATEANQKMAYKIYDLSQELSQPGNDGLKNWVVAWRMWI